MHPLTYYSIDIETTGLDIQKSQILEIGCVKVYPNGDKEEFHSIVCDPILYGEPYALSMHSELLKLIAGHGGAHKPVQNAIKELSIFIQGENSPVLAGKNVAMFDLPILRNWGFTEKVKHRVMDVGNMYFHKFGYIPSLDEINKLIDYTPVSHRALDDAKNVVAAIEYLQRELNETKK